MNKLIKIISVVTIFVFLRTGFALCAEQVYFYYTDPAGTPLAMSDAGGNVVWRADYMPFGEESIGTQTIQNNKMFVGKEKDSESGLYYFGARYMDAGAGRFASPDSIVAVDPNTGEINQIILHDPQRLNLYAYGLNNPYKYKDDGGKFTEAIVPVAIIGIPVLMLAWHKFATDPAVQKRFNEIFRSQDSAEQSQAQSSDTNKETQKIGEQTDMKDTSTWPKPPTDLPTREAEPSRKKPRERGEKSLVDSKGGEWRPHKPDKYHPEGHWDYKENPQAPWINVPQQ